MYCCSSLIGPSTGRKRLCGLDNKNALPYRLQITSFYSFSSCQVICAVHTFLHTAIIILCPISCYLKTWCNHCTPCVPALPSFVQICMQIRPSKPKADTSSLHTHTHTHTNMCVFIGSIRTFWISFPHLPFFASKSSACYKFRNFHIYIYVLVAIFKKKRSRSRLTSYQRPPVEGRHICFLCF